MDRSRVVFVLRCSWQFNCPGPSGALKKRTISPLLRKALGAQEIAKKKKKVFWQFLEGSEPIKIASNAASVETQQPRGEIDQQDQGSVESVMNEQLKSLQDDKIWHSYRVRLTAFAYTLIREQFWDGNNTGPLLAGMEHSDFASEALIDVFAGEEPWDAERYPNLLTHLFYIVRKRIENAVRRHDATRVFHVDDDDEFGSAENHSSPESEVEAEALIDGFLAFLDGEDDLQLLIHCMKEGTLKRADIADSLGLQPADITNMSKRLHRRSEEYQQQIYKNRKSLG